MRRQFASFADTITSVLGAICQVNAVVVTRIAALGLRALDLARFLLVRLSGQAALAPCAAALRRAHAHADKAGAHPMSKRDDRFGMMGSRPCWRPEERGAWPTGF